MSKSIDDNCVIIKLPATYLNIKICQGVLSFVLSMGPINQIVPHLWLYHTPLVDVGVVYQHQGQVYMHCQGFWPPLMIQILGVILVCMTDLCIHLSVAVFPSITCVCIFRQCFSERSSRIHWSAGRACQNSRLRGGVWYRWAACNNRLAGDIDKIFQF